ncbi:MAG: hypothetical protein EOO20_06225 [Chryseobacterium sp.]|nr:MAG: hypothetical protein EOO20_06225 [Chryseobacterium sp.]
MRTGIIIAYNSKAKIGIINYSNDQKIKFHVEGIPEAFKRFDVVQFDISFVSGSLRAVNIIQVLDNHGQPVSMTVGHEVSVK